MYSADRFALRDLVARYAQAADSRDPAAFAPLFTSDAVVALIKDGEHEQVRGREQIVERLSRVLKYERTYHLLGQQTVELAGDHGRGETYCLAHHLSVTAEAPPEIMVAYVRYQDQYVRNDEIWRFRERTIVIDWMEWRSVACVGRSGSTSSSD